MGVNISFTPDERRLEISFEGNLDVTVWLEVCNTCARVPPNLKACIVDLTRVGRVFDSGMALLVLLYERLRAIGVMVIFLSDNADVRQRIAIIASAGG